VCAEHFSRRLPGYAEQFRMRPGITGLSQLKAGDHAHASLKLKYDLEYLEKRSLTTDLSILCQTIGKLLVIQLRLLARQLGNLWGPTDLVPAQSDGGHRRSRQQAVKGD
jgi:hypothetical protein